MMDKYIPRLIGLARRIRRRYKPMGMPPHHIDKDGKAYTWKAWQRRAKREGKFALIDSLEPEVRRQIWGRDYEAADAREQRASPRRRVLHADLVPFLIDATAAAQRSMTTDWGHMTGRTLRGPTAQKECKK